MSSRGGGGARTAAGTGRAARARSILPTLEYCLTTAHRHRTTLNDGGDESRLEVDYPLGGLRDAEDQVLDEVGDASVRDDEEPRDGPGHALRQVVALGGAVLALRPRVATGRARRRARYQLYTYTNTYVKKTIPYIRTLPRYCSI